MSDNIQWGLAPSAPVNAFMVGFDRAREARDLKAQRNALASGDMSAVMQINPGLGLQMNQDRRAQQDQAWQGQDRQVQAQQLARTNARQDRADTFELSQAQGQLLNQFANRARAFGDNPQALLQAVDAWAPQFMGAGFTPEDLQGLKEDLANDPGQALAFFADPARLQVVNRSGGAYDVRNLDTGGLVDSVDALPPDPLDVEYRQAQIAATQALVPQRQAAAANSRSIAANRGAGGSGGGSGPWSNY